MKVTVEAPRRTIVSVVEQHKPALPSLGFEDRCTHFGDNRSLLQLSSMYPPTNNIQAPAPSPSPPRCVRYSITHITYGFVSATRASSRSSLDVVPIHITTLCGWPCAVASIDVVLGEDFNNN